MTFASAGGRGRGRARVADPPADPVAVARTVCLQLLTRAPRTRAQLAVALDHRGVPPDAATEVLDRMVEVGLVDDAAYADAWVQTRHAGRGLARRALAAELQARGVADEQVAAALTGVDRDAETDMARRLVERRAPSTAGLARPVRERRLVGMLARKGYSTGLAVRVVREVLECEDAADTDGGLDDELDDVGLP